MYLFILMICGLFVDGVYFSIYTIVEIILLVKIFNTNKKKENEHLPSARKAIGELVLCRLCSTVAWCIIFSITNSLFTETKENGWEILDYWFPPNAFYLYYPSWHLIIVLAVCLISTLATFQIYLLKRKQLLYYATILLTTLIMFCILTSAGVPLYWH